MWSQRRGFPLRLLKTEVLFDEIVISQEYVVLFLESIFTFCRAQVVPAFVQIDTNNLASLERKWHQLKVKAYLCLDVPFTYRLFLASIKS